MFKWINWIVRTIATVLLLSFLSIWTTGYIVNSYMETLLKQLDLPLQTQPFALSGVWGRMWGASPAPNAENSGAIEPAPSNQADPSLDGGHVFPSPSPHAIPGAGLSESPGPSPNEAGPETPPSGNPNPAVGEDSIPAFNGNAGILDMTDQQRQLLNTVMAKLNADQLGKLSVSLQDGLTAQELQELGVIIKPSLSEKEYGQMMELLQSRVGKPDTPTTDPSPQPSAQPQ